MLKNQELQEILRKAIRAKLNVLLEGPHGQGKSSCILAVAQELELRVKYFSASTLDPFADLIGIPVPVEQNGNHRLVFHQQEDLLDADLLIFDELNRAHPRILNAILEIIQFRRLNGQPLPHLRCVIAAINPPDGNYQVTDLDPALVDRFQLHLKVQSGPDADWFKTTFGKKLGTVLLEWFQTDLDKTQQQAVSPRRLEYIGRTVQEGMDPIHAGLPGIKLPFNLLEMRLKEKETILNIEDFVARADEFAGKVAEDMNIAVRFSQLLPMMKPAQKCALKFALLALPAEVLAQLNAGHPFVFKKTADAVRLLEGAENAEAFEQLLEERMRPLRAPRRMADHEHNQNDRQRSRAA